MKNTTPKLGTIKKYTLQRKLELALNPLTPPQVLHDLYHLSEEYSDNEIKQAIRCNPNITREMCVSFITEYYSKPFTNPALDLFMMEDGFLQEIIRDDTAPLYINNSMDRRLMKLVLEHQINECVRTNTLPKGLYFGCTNAALVKEFPSIMDRLLKHAAFGRYKVETTGSSIERGFASELLRCRLADDPQGYLELVSKEIVTWKFLLHNMYYIPKAQHAQFIKDLLIHADTSATRKQYLRDTVGLAIESSVELHDIMYSLTNVLSSYILN